MKRPWMPLYVGDYLADTAHLNAAESGAYLHLIMHYWVNGCLPNDDRQLRRITRLTSRQWAQSRDILRSHFGDNWKHHRIDQEIAQAVEISKTNSANAKRSHKFRRRFAGVSQDTLTLTHTKKEGNGILKEGFKALPTSPEFIRWKAYAFEKNVSLWRELQKREEEGRGFDFESQWPP